MKLISSDFRNLNQKIITNLNNKTSDEKIDSRFISATISIEDKRFYFHYGHDVFSIIRAIINNIFNKRIQGASTIEQQLIRSILKNNEISFKRKLIEILLSTELNHIFSKQEIIELYLRHYNFSEKIIGIEALCKHENYRLENPTNKEIYEISARFKYPNISKSNYSRFLKRVRTIEKLNTE